MERIANVRLCELLTDPGDCDNDVPPEATDLRHAILQNPALFNAVEAYLSRLYLMQGEKAIRESKKGDATGAAFQLAKQDMCREILHDLTHRPQAPTPPMEI